MRNSKVVGQADFRGALFADLNLSGSTFGTLWLSNTLYDRLIYSGSTQKFFRALDKGFNPDIRTDKQKYDTLEKLRANFAASNQPSLSNEAYFQKSILERRYNSETESRLNWRQLGFWGWVSLAWNYLSFYTSGYFVKADRAFLVSLILICLFGFTFFFIDSAATKRGNDLAMLWNAFVLSFSKFTRIKTERVLAKRIHWLETLESIIGIFMIVSLTIAIANSVPGLERIVGAILPT